MTDCGYAFSSPLARRRLLEIPSGTLGVREHGAGPPLVLIPGLVANGLAWRNVAPGLPGFRCIAPDWPLGSHSPAMPDADLTLGGLAGVVVEVLDSLSIEQAVIVGNGYGGDIAQILAAEHPDRVTALVLIACNAFDSNPWPTRAVAWLSRPPGASTAQALLMRSKRVQRLPFNYGWATKRPIPPWVMHAYLDPFIRDSAVRRDFHRFLRALNPADLTVAGAKLCGFDRPALVITAAEDRVFPVDALCRLAEWIPDADTETIHDSYAWIPEDQPAELARLLRAFLANLHQADAPISSTTTPSHK